MAGMWCSLFVSLLLAHLVGDFVLQTDSLCKQKREKKAGSPFTKPKASPRRPFCAGSPPTCSSKRF